MPKIFLIKNRLHQQQQRLLESQNLLQHKAQDDERCLVPPLSPSSNSSRVDRVSPASSDSSSTSPAPTRPTPTPTPTPPTAPEPQPEPQDQHDQQQQQQQQEEEQPLSLTTATATTSAASTSTRKRFHHRRHYFGQTRHSLESNSCVDVAVAAASQVQNGK